MHADGYAVFHLRHRGHAAFWKPQDGPEYCHRATQQFQTHLPVTHALVQVIADIRRSQKRKNLYLLLTSSF